MTKQSNNNIKILFVCHGNILKSPGIACKINVFTEQSSAYYTTITPCWERALNDRSNEIDRRG